MTAKNFADVRTEDRRLSILLVLESSPRYEANAHLVREMIERYYGHSASLDTVRADLAWLAEQGLAQVEELQGLPLARASGRGIDVALGRANCPGVKRPLP